MARWSKIKAEPEIKAEPALPRKIKAEPALPLLLKLPEELRTLIFEAAGVRHLGAVAPVCRWLGATVPQLARALAEAQDAAAAVARRSSALLAKQRRAAARLAAEQRRAALVGARLRVLLDRGNGLERWAVGAITNYTMNGEPSISGAGTSYTFFMEEGAGYVDERWASTAEFENCCCVCEVGEWEQCVVCAHGRSPSYILTV